MHWAVCILVLFSINVEFSIQFTSHGTRIKLLESKYDILEAKVYGMNRDIESIWETVNETRNMNEVDVISERNTSELSSSYPAGTAIKECRCPQALGNKLNYIEKGVADAKQATKKRLQEFKTEFKTEFSKYERTVSDIKRKQNDVLDNIDEIQKQLPEKDAMIDQIATYVKTTVSDANNVINDKLTVLSERFETTVLNQTNEINALTILAEEYETTISKQTNDIKHLNAKYDELMTQFNLYLKKNPKQQVSPDILKQSDWKQFGISMYKRFTVYLNWMDAMQMCKLSSAGQGYLAEIHSSYEKNFVKNMMNDGEFWLGGCQSQHTQGAVWRWCGTNQVMGRYRPWARGEPSNSKTIENCLQSWRRGGLWNDRNCYEFLPFVCEIPIQESNP